MGFKVAAMLNKMALGLFDPIYRCPSLLRTDEICFIPPFLTLNCQRWLLLQALSTRAVFSFYVDIYSVGIHCLQKVVFGMAH